MSEKIDETLKKLAAGIPSETSGQADQNEVTPAGLLGDPNCPHCGGIGYLRLELPVGHPEFGKLHICTCRRAQVSQVVHQRLFALSNLDELRHMTFENFNPRGRVGLWPQQAASLERAYNQASQFARALNGWLLLMGKFGCGKTHLAAAIANFAVEMGVPSLFITVPDLLDTLRFAYQDPTETFEQRFDQIRNAPLLVLDDFGTQNATAWAQEKLFQILNYRYINKLPLVVTTNLTLTDIEGRIRSRLEDPELVTQVRIAAPDYRRPTEDMGYHELSTLNMVNRLTFATFDLRSGEGLPAGDLKNLEAALLAAREYAEHPSGWIIFTGPYGSGKTHLAAAIANYQKDLGGEPLFIVVPDLLDHLRATFSPNSPVTLDQRFEEIRNAPLLVLDDLGTQATTPWVREKLYQLFNRRYIAELPTVITTSDHWDDIDPRLASRMRDPRIGTIYPLNVPAYRGAPRRAGRRSTRRRSEAKKD